MLRFYVVVWAPTLWKTWCVACRWGRISEDPRGTRLHECASLRGLALGCQPRWRPAPGCRGDRTSTEARLHGAL